ncbi:MAG: Lrp/AsnC family transcriptional regulator [Candidatus Methanofastidiosia archaeon]
MDSPALLRLYHEIYLNIVSKTRIPISHIARSMGRTGRGRASSTISRHLSTMYEKGISFSPTLLVDSFQNSRNMVYFCRKTERRDISSTFEKLLRDEKMSYALFVSGRCDYFVTSRDGTLDFEEYNLEIVEKSELHSLIVTLPQGWNLSMEDVLKSFVDYDYAKGMLPRELKGNLPWSDLDWRIYEITRKNARLPLIKIARDVGSSPLTVRDHLYNTVFPACVPVNYFFPKGYDSYLKLLLQVRTQYEKSFVNALERLPCTSFVAPLEEGLAVGVFHENINDMMAAIGRLEEMGVIDDYCIYTPLNNLHLHDLPERPGSGQSGSASLLNPWET